MEKFVEIAKTIFEDPRSLLIVPGVIIAVIAAAGGVQGYLTIPPGVPQIGLAIFGVVLAFFGVYLVFLDSKPKGVTVTYPTQNEDVEAEFDVRGTVRKIPTGKTLWLVRIYNDGRYTPVNRIVVQQGAREWKARFTVGGSGKQIGVFMVGEEGRALFDFRKEVVEKLDRLARDQNIPNSAENRYPPAFDRDTVRALKIKECQVVDFKLGSKAKRV